MLAALAASLLQACGGGSDSGSGTARLVNASDDYASLDLYSTTTSNGVSTDTLLAGGVTTDTAGTYVSLGATSYVFNLKRAGSSTTSNTSTRTVVKGASHTLVAYSTSGALKTVFLNDNEPVPTSGTAKFRVFNASDEAGTLDVYVTDPAAPLAGSAATASGLAIERISTYTEIGAGTYRIRVTGAGDTTDLRLDLPAVTLTNPQILTLVLTSSPGGVLVHGRIIDQGGTVAPERNPSARVRLVAGAGANGTVAATVNGTTLSTSQQSPTIGNYKLVDAGALVLNVTLNGGPPLPITATTLLAGSDNTLLVTSSGASGTATLIGDDNRPPLTTGNAKLRLVHGVGNLAGLVTLSANFRVVATDVSTNSASTPASIPANAVNTTTSLSATTPTVTTPLYKADAALQAGHVYTVFVLGDVAAPATGALSGDR